MVVVWYSIEINLLRRIKMDKIRVAILGAGTVGTGVYKLINKQADEMIHKVGLILRLLKS